MSLLRFLVERKRKDIECWLRQHQPDALFQQVDHYGYKVTRCKRCRRVIRSFDGDWWITE